MFFQRPPRNGFGLGTNFNQDPFGNSLIAETRPQPRPQPMMNSGYPVLDLIAGLGQVFNRQPVMTTPPYVPSQRGDWGMGQNDNDSILSGGIFGTMVIEENPQPKPRTEYDIWGNPITRYPMDERPDPVDPGFYIKDKPSDGFFARPWRDDTEQQDWLTRWDIQPANDARYLPTFPEPDDTSTGAAIRRDWHNSYKDFAKNTIGQYAPMFAEQMPQPQPQQSYGDFMGEIKNTANTLVNSAASQLGGGLGQALSFIPGLGPIMELIGQGANIASTVAGATGLGGEKAGAALNLIGSVANDAAGGAATSGGTEEFGPPMPNEGGMFSGLRPNQQPSPTAPGTPPFKPQPAPAASDGEGSWFKPLDQMFKEIDERQARGEIFDEKTNSWTKPVTADSEPSKPELRGKSEATSSNSAPIKSLGGITPSATEEADFQKHLKGMLREEGGYSNNPNDPGGETDRGISNRFYQDFLKRKDIDKTQWPNRVTDLSDKQRDLIYRSEFYFDRKYNKINDSDVRDIIFNNAVNAGPARAEGFSAEALKRIDPKINLGGDNSIGPKHRAAIDKIKKEGKLDEYLHNYADIRAEYNKSLSKTLQDEFGKGWSNRNERSRPEPKKPNSNPNQKP